MKKVESFQDIEVDPPSAGKTTTSCPKCKSSKHCYLIYLGGHNRHSCVPVSYEGTYCKTCKSTWLTGEQLAEKMRKVFTYR